MKKTVIISLICLVILLVLIIMVTDQNSDHNSLTENENKQNIEENQSTLEVMIEEPKQVENSIVQKADATYEEWLSAAVVIGISLQYPEYEFKEIYLAPEAAYIVFECGGEMITIHSERLDDERTEAGTNDLHTKDLGFATFDEIAEGEIDKEQCELIELEDLSELISQSMLVSVYEH